MFHSKSVDIEGLRLKRIEKSNMVEGECSICKKQTWVSARQLNLCQSCFSTIIVNSSSWRPWDEWQVACFWLVIAPFAILPLIAILTDGFPIVEFFLGGLCVLALSDILNRLTRYKRH